jgi:predicted Zn-dependent protease
VQQGESADRAAKAFARLNPSSKLPGFNWRLVVLRSPENLGSGVLDGTIFLSNGLVSRLSNDELVALIAHLLGHAAYRHDHDFWTEASSAERVGVAAAAIIGGPVLIGVGLLACGGNPDACDGGLKIAGAGLQITGSGLVDATKVASGPSEIPPPDQESVHSDYSRDQEVEANFMAVKYLHDVGIPPDTPFDALVKLAKEPSPFSKLHHADISAADLGRMLDAGVIPTK